jgi:hypothetical protein
LIKQHKQFFKKFQINHHEKIIFNPCQLEKTFLDEPLIDKVKYQYYPYLKPSYIPERSRWILLIAKPLNPNSFNVDQFKNFPQILKDSNKYWLFFHIFDEIKVNILINEITYPIDQTLLIIGFFGSTDRFNVQQIKQKIQLSF